MAPPLRSLVPCCLYLLCGASALFGAAPSIQSVSLSGLQTGGTTTLAVTGSDLLPSPRVLLPIPVAAQAVKPGATEYCDAVDENCDGNVNGSTTEAAA